jgi:pimeloyl-ACP methyl ester carboxylesterase
MKKTVRRAIVICSIIAGVCAAVFLAAGWFFSTMLYQKALDTHRTGPANNVRILSIDGQSAILEKLQTAGNAYRRAGAFELSWSGGVGRVTDVLESDDLRAKRSFSLLEGNLPAAGTEAIVSSFFGPRDSYPIPELPAEKVVISSELGSFDAYRTPGSGKTWVILVHGNGMRVAEVRKMAGSFLSLGHPTLAITYRNDPGQPRDPSGILQYGLTEWKELDGAVGYALEQGSDGVVIFGLSMGGGIALSFMYQSTLANRVTGLILDSPMTDFSKAVDINAAKERLPLIGLPVPQALVNAAKLISGIRFGVSWSRMNYLAKMDELTAPILLFHGTGDTVVPVSTSDELAAGRKDLIFAYMRSEGVEHCESWNFDTETYKRHLRRFMDFVTGWID